MHLCVLCVGSRNGSGGGFRCEISLVHQCLTAGHMGCQHNLNMRLEGFHVKCRSGSEWADKPSLSNREMGAERGPNAVVGRSGMCAFNGGIAAEGQNGDP